jgi:hypothetical protein
VLVAGARARLGRDTTGPQDETTRGAPGPASVLVRARTATLERVAARPAGAPPPVLATWLLGAVVLGCGVLLLALTLVVRA